MSRKLPPIFDLSIESLAPSGEGVGFFSGREVNVFGAFPGEIIKARPTKRKKKVWKAELVEVLKKRSDRRTKKEAHYLSCSPWQVLSEESQLNFKKQMVYEAFKKNFGEIIPEPQIISSEKKFNYRNKIEFSFVESKGKLKLAFHKRYRHGQYSTLESCCLAKKEINEVSKRILKELNSNGLKKEQLKNLLLRYSYKENKVLATLYVVDKKIYLFDIEDDYLSGWQIIYSDPLSPFIKTTKVLFSTGKNTLCEKIKDVDLEYYYDSFFQINPRAFEKIIDYLKEKTNKNKTLVDLYSGVGTIGLALANNFENIHMVEFDKKASKVSLSNARNNNIKNIKIYSGETEKQELRNFLNPEDTLVVDPPRSGMHPKAILQILEISPKYFNYISCNPYTQLNDMLEILNKYTVIDWRLFDIYPQTPHLESVFILERKVLT